MGFRFDRGDKAVLARQPDDYTWVRHGRELTIGKAYTILSLAPFTNIDAYVIKNDRSCIATIEDKYFDPVE
jgi:hypothetical protein